MEFALTPSPLILVFDFNPQTLRRARTINITAGTTPATRGGYDFSLPTETSRAAQGVSIEPENFDVEILLDATDRMDKADPIAAEFGIEPQLDTLRSMVTPKVQGPGGMQMLAGLGFSGTRAFMRDPSPSVLLFVWGSHILPVFLKQIDVREVAHMPTLVPFRAEVRISMQVIEGNNPFYQVEKIRQVVGAALNTGATIAGGANG